jgi:hypothetical protein
MKKLMGMALLLASVAGFGCGGSSISNFRMQLAPGAIRRSEVLVVVPVDASRTVFEGDYSDDPPSVAQGRITLQTSYAPRLAAAMQAAGLRAMVAGPGVPPDAVFIYLQVTKFDAGSNAARAMVGFGAGASYMLTVVAVRRGQAPLAEFTVDASSGGRGGLGALGSWLDTHLAQSVDSITAYLSTQIR